MTTIRTPTDAECRAVQERLRRLAEEHGADLDDSDDLDDMQREAEAARERRRRERLRLRLDAMRHVGVRPPELHATSESLGERQRHAAVRLSRAPRSVLIHGPTGTGKSWWAAAATGEWLEREAERVSRVEPWHHAHTRGVTTRMDMPTGRAREVPDYCGRTAWATVAGFFKCRRDVIGGNRFAIARSDAITNAEWLVLDDLGANGFVTSTQWRLEELMELLEARAARSATIITTNVAPDDLERDINAAAEHWGSRLVSRVMGLVENRRWHFDGPDRRRA